MTHRFFLTSTAMVALALSASSASAQITPGSRFTFNGVANATDIGSPGVILNFSSDVVVDRAGNTGAFASFNRATGYQLAGRIQQITVGNGPQPIAGFLSLGGYHFDLQSLPSGPYGQEECYVYPVPGQHCTPYQSPGFALSPFYLVNTYSGDPDAPLNSVASFNLIGSVADANGASSAFYGTISSTFIGLSFQEALGSLEQFGLSGVPFNGVFVAGAPPVASGPALGAVPEPSTYVLVGTGLLGVMAVGRRRRRR